MEITPTYLALSDPLKPLLNYHVAENGIRPFSPHSKAKFQAHYRDPTLI
jgi:hypothetical protein